jgi:uncharacterized protein (DUF488 family)
MNMAEAMISGTVRARGRATSSTLGAGIISERPNVPRAQGHPIIDRDLFTIGYEGAAVRGLLDALRDAGVEHLIDVRALPLSRKPGFSKRALQASLEEAGLRYTHLQPLGTPKPGRDAARKRDLAGLTRIYAAHLATPPAQLALAQAADLAGRSRCCLLCFEADPACCHRTIVGEAIGARLVHITPKA